MTLNRKCNLFFGALYTLVYPCLIMLSTNLTLRGYDSQIITVVISICALITVILKPLISIIFDKGYCRVVVTMLALCMLVGSLFFYFNQQQTLVTALIYAVLCLSCCELLIEMADCWVGKLAIIDSAIDYGKCRGFGSLSFALISLVYGIGVDRFGLVLFPISVCFSALLVLWVGLTLPQVKQEESTKKIPLADELKELMNGRLIAYAFVFALAMCAINLCDNYADPVILEKGGTTVATGIYDFSRCIVETIVMMNASRLIERFGISTVCTIGLVGLFIKPLLLALSPSIPLTVTTALMQGIGFPLVIPARIFILSRLVKKDHLALMVSIISILTALLYSLLVNPMMAYLAKQSSIATAIAICSSVSLLAVIIYIMANRKKEVK